MVGYNKTSLDYVCAECITRAKLNEDQYTVFPAARQNVVAKIQFTREILLFRKMQLKQNQNALAKRVKENKRIVEKQFQDHIKMVKTIFTEYRKS